MGKKGTVTPLADVLPLGELAKASDHIQNSIREQSERLEQLQAFADDNRSVHKLVQDLPHNVSYNIMVPFGKAAFFPGKLVHTNEMMVLLGEGYYAERSAKQTVDILSRRSKFLDSTIEGVTAQIADLKAEASFATTAAEEAAAGVVDIREEYDEETDARSYDQRPEHFTGVERRPKSDEDLEYDRLMAQFSELEAEEMAAAEKELQDEFVQFSNEDDSPANILEEGILEKEDILTEEEREVEQDESNQPPKITNPGDLLKFEMWKQRKLESPKDQIIPERKEKKRVSFGPSVDDLREAEGKRSIDPRNRTSSQPQPSSSSTKVFGSVLERSPTDTTLEIKAPENSAKPVSRFRQRLG